jgi:hypothetical protein
MASGILTATTIKLTATTIKRHFMLSGGSSTRLWPFSCSMYPEQFLKFFCSETILQQTVAAWTIHASTRLRLTFGFLLEGSRNILRGRLGKTVLVRMEVQQPNSAMKSGLELLECT